MGKLNCRVFWPPMRDELFRNCEEYLFAILVPHEFNQGRRKVFIFARGFGDLQKLLNFIGGSFLLR